MSSESVDDERRPSLKRFFFAVNCELALALLLFAWIAPSMFSYEIHRPAQLFYWTVALGLPLSLFEYLYHRYLLHSAVFPFMAAMHRAHSTHHSLTHVKASITPQDPERLVDVSSEFPIEEPHQEESMMFPLYSLPIFYGVFLILIATPLKLLLPSQPLLLATLLTVTLYYGAYEIWHAILHLPFEKFWKPHLAGRAGPMFKQMYSFHLMHHWRPTSNLAIVGFWGLAIWDHIFRTHKRPRRLPLDQAQVNYNDARLKKPLWPISQLDRWQSGLYRASRHLERFLARMFLRRRSDSN